MIVGNGCEAELSCLMVRMASGLIRDRGKGTIVLRCVFIAHYTCVVSMNAGLVAWMVYTYSNSSLPAARSTHSLVARLAVWVSKFRLDS